jgi:hypothetical protein
MKMFTLKIEQKDFNRAYFYFESIESAAEFVDNCMKFDDGETIYTITYVPMKEKAGEE